MSALSIPAPITHSPSLGRRVAAMTLLWASFGLFVGIDIAPPSGLIGFASCILAGLIVLTPIGPVLGLLGGRAKATLVGGLVGTLLGLLAGGFTPAGISHLASTGLIFGGLAGATGSVYFAFVLFVLRLATPLGRAR